MQSESIDKLTVWPRLWRAALGIFVLAALSGAFLRLWMGFGFPAGIDLVNWRHAHSHLMYFGWVTPALMALIASYLPGSALFRPTITAVLVFGLLTFAPFALWGYSPAQIGNARLPISVIFSTFNILAWYVFIFQFFRLTGGRRGDRSARLWAGALVFLALASLGAWGRAVLAAMQIDDLFTSTAMVHLFLDLFSDGWFVLALLGLAYAAHPRLATHLTPAADWLLFLGLPPTFLLSVPVGLVPAGLRMLAAAGGILYAAGLIAHLRVLWSAGGAWRLPLVFLGLKALTTAGLALPEVAGWGEQAGLRILYLHLLLLGFTSLGLFAAARQRWGTASVPGLRGMQIAAVTLLFSLLPLTGLWPAALGGRWRLYVAAAAAFGPFLAALVTFIKSRDDGPETRQVETRASADQTALQRREAAGDVRVRG